MTLLDLPDAQRDDLTWAIDRLRIDPSLEGRCWVRARLIDEWGWPTGPELYLAAVAVTGGGDHGGVGEGRDE